MSGEPGTEPSDKKTQDLFPVPAPLGQGPGGTDGGQKRDTQTDEGPSSFKPRLGSKDNVEQFKGVTPVYGQTTEKKIVKASTKVKAIYDAVYVCLSSTKEQSLLLPCGSVGPKCSVRPIMGLETACCYVCL